MSAFRKFICASRNRLYGAVALNTGLALIPVMIALSFAFDRSQI